MPSTEILAKIADVIEVLPLDIMTQQQTVMVKNSRWCEPTVRTLNQILSGSC